MSLYKIAAKWSQIFKAYKDPKLSYLAREAFKNELSTLSRKIRANRLYWEGSSLLNMVGEWGGLLTDIGKKNTSVGAKFLEHVRNNPKFHKVRAERLEKMLELAKKKGKALGIPESEMEIAIKGGSSIFDDLLKL